MHFNKKYPENIIEGINEYGANLEIPLNEDQSKGLEYAISETLTPKEIEVINLLFREHLSLRKCGGKLGITSDSVTEIVNWALAQLYHSGNLSYIKLGYSKCKER